MICINCTLYEFLRENMSTGISNMKNIHERMLWNLYVSCSQDYCADSNNIIFQVWKESKMMRSNQNWLIIPWKYTRNLDEVIIQTPANSDFGLGARILQIGWFYRPKWKIFEKSASKNKQVIKLRFSNWSLQSDNPEKKVILETVNLDHILC